MVANERDFKDKDSGLTGPRNKKTVMDYVLVLFFLVAIFVTFAPMINILARSISGAQALALNQVGLWPVGFHLDAYTMIFRDSAYTRALWFTTYLTAAAVIVSMTLTISCAFPLTYDKLKGRKAFSIFMILTMYFSAGLIPFYLLMADLSLLNTFWVLVIPNALSVFNVIIMRAFFFAIPSSLKESAEVEGANPFQILVRIYLPLATPVLATLTLFYAVGRWNGFADALMFIDSQHSHLHPIQLLLWRLLQAMTNIEASAMEGFTDTAWSGGLTESLRAATIIIATVPILLLYPWLQRYFISGVTLGAVKE